jgi:hypothetical protein
MRPLLEGYVPMLVNKYPKDAKLAFLSTLGNILPKQEKHNEEMLRRGKERRNSDNRGRLDRTALPLDILNNASLQLPIHNTHLRSKRGGRLPLGAGPRSGLFHHLINLLKSKTLRLRNKEVGVNAGACAQATPDKEDLIICKRLEEKKSYFLCH